MPNNNDKERNQPRPSPHSSRPTPRPPRRRRRSGPFALGGLPDMPDVRDYKISDSLGRLNKSYLSDSQPSVPDTVDLFQTGYLTAVEDQKELGSCTANAVIGLVEYLLNKTDGKQRDFSRLFLYKVTRNYMGYVGDRGASIRDTIKAMKLFGVVPSEWWPYIIEDFDIEPDAFLYAMAQSFQAIDHRRIDPVGSDVNQVIDNIELTLAAGFPIAFGFWVVPSLYSVNAIKPIVPLPNATERIEGGHAVLAIGYDRTKKQIKIRNSWGTGWGNSGYAWMPYEYVTRGLAFDFWTILSQESGA